MSRDDEPYGGYGERARPRSRFQEDVTLLTDRAYGYVRSRTAEHWILFLSGLALGLLLA